MTDINELRRRFSIPSVVTIEPARGGLPRVAVTTEQGEAHIYLHGAHVTHYRPRAGSELLFLSGKSLFEAGKAIRGGVPLIFPWFGPKADDPKAPMHGFARTTEWTLIGVGHLSDGSVSVQLEMNSTPQTMAIWPHAFRLVYTVRVSTTLDLVLEVHNPGNTPFGYEEALHTYLAVGDVRHAQISGLAGREFLDKTDGARRKTQPAGRIGIISETDRVYLNTADEVTVLDPFVGREIFVSKEGSKATVLWNPWIAKAKAMADFGDDEWPAMLCIETANAAENSVTVAGGKSHKMTARIAWKPAPISESKSETRQWEMSGK
ncbi:MAG TPA: D-hexose-6-phosphate mutarotase [Verrucomicrobiaceae bacterium]